MSKTYTPSEAIKFLGDSLKAVMDKAKPEIDALVKAEHNSNEKQTDTLAPEKQKEGSHTPSQAKSKKIEGPGSGGQIKKGSKGVKPKSESAELLKDEADMTKAVPGMGQNKNKMGPRGGYTGSSMMRGAVQKAGPTGMTPPKPPAAPAMPKAPSQPAMAKPPQPPKPPMAKAGPPPMNPEPDLGGGRPFVKDADSIKAEFAKMDSHMCKGLADGMVAPKGEVIQGPSVIKSPARVTSRFDKTMVAKDEETPVPQVTKAIGDSGESHFGNKHPPRIAAPKKPASSVRGSLSTNGELRTGQVHGADLNPVQSPVQKVAPAPQRPATPVTKPDVKTPKAVGPKAVAVEEDRGYLSKLHNGVGHDEWPRDENHKAPDWMSHKAELDKMDQMFASKSMQKDQKAPIPLPGAGHPTDKVPGVVHTADHAGRAEMFHQATPKGFHPKFGKPLGDPGGKVHGVTDSKGPGRAAMYAEHTPPGHHDLPIIPGHEIE